MTPDYTQKHPVSPVTEPVNVQQISAWFKAGEVPRTSKAALLQTLRHLHEELDETVKALLEPQAAALYDAKHAAVRALFEPTPSEEGLPAAAAELQPGSIQHLSSANMDALVEAVDGLGDLIVVALQGFHVLKANPNKHLMAIAYANWDKFRDGVTKNENGKITKPANWVGPEATHRKLLETTWG